MDLPNKKYKIIYADPPWKYDFGETSSRFVNKKYPVMTKEEICNLPIKDIANNDCVLFIWVTNPKLDWGFDVIKSWGFEYKTVGFYWIKTNGHSNSLFWGLGYYTRSNPEICLLATKGKPLKRLSHSIHSVVMHPVLSHSEKPIVFKNKIVELFGNVTRIELFARQKVEGWDCYGNELSDTIQRLII